MIAVLAIAATPYFVKLGASSLWDSNEAFYAETPREMIESHDYVNPTFNYRARLNKPPLSYWIVAPFYLLLGVSEAAQRLPIVLGAMILLSTAYGLGRAVYSVDAGLLAAIGMAAAPRFLMFSRRIMIDVYLAVFMGLALLMFVLAEKRPERRRLYLILMYAALGLGVMTKGPVAVVLPAAALTIYLLIYRRFDKLRDLMLPAGLIIIAAIVLPWYVAIYFQHGWGHIQTFILQDNISRYTQAVWGPRRGLFFYFPAVMGDFFPWSLFMVPLAWLGVRRLWLFYRGERQSSSDLSGSAMLAIWIAVIFVFFSISKSKEDLYILPIYPAAAALVGGLLAAGFTGQPLGHVRFTTLSLAAGLAASGVVILVLFDDGTRLYEIEGANLIGYFAILGGLITATAAILARTRSAILASALTVAACNWVFVMRALPDFERFKPVRPLCEVITAEAGPDALVGYYRTAYPSMVFYLGRPIFEYYHQAEIEAAFTAGKQVFCIMNESEYEAFKSRVPVQTRVLASHPIFRVKLNGILDTVELPRVVLISNKGGTDVTQ
ncbi:MAG TPA: glycosyltransferase family 39 protein [Blastocatellia bacterium]|nr:glycosyltransferase family 39 protein [Blastocatellia bacterium]